MISPTDSFAKNAAILSDDDLLDLVQKQTLKYFWDYGHPVNGMARERWSAGQYDSYDCNETVTTGGTGFGIMAMLVGVHRGWLGAGDVLARLHLITDFLATAEKHNGVLPHFIDSRTGRANHFVESENGGNIVETAFLMVGLLAARQYFSAPAMDQVALRDKINTLYGAVDWVSHQPADKPELRWLHHPHLGLGHWPVTGWNEALITYILAAGAPGHAIAPEIYHRGWADGVDFFRNGRDFYGMTLPLGPDGGGPLFFSHYSFLGLDPRGLRDAYADYGVQNTHQTRINYAHCVSNPHGHAGYGPDCWGLTASDTPGGYDVHSPANDTGTIAPTAALSAFPYTPDLSMRALRHFYHNRDYNLWGPYGFYDAFNPGQKWSSQSYLAIDQGPIVVMIENHRSGLLWSLVMSCPEIRAGLKRLSFHSPHLAPASALTAPNP